jgi:penicillin-binding protein 1B
VIDHGTARNARGAIKGVAVAGKTGTSRDGWFVGYTPNLVCAVWIGFDDNKQLGLTGAEAALPAWVEFMKHAVELKPELGGRSFEQPEGIKVVNIDPETSQLASAKCPHRETVALPTPQAPTSDCYLHSIYFDTPATVQQPKSEIPAYAKVERQKLRNGPAWSVAQVEDPLLRQTRVDRNLIGRPTLVNDLRLR